MTDNQQQGGDLVRRDFIDAYCEKWGVTQERAESLMQHVEIGAGEDALADFYQKLCHMHTGVLLQHGGQVSQGLALAVVAAVELIPEDKKREAEERWARQAHSTADGG